jgi:hypothetical protein
MLRVGTHEGSGSCCEWARMKAAGHAASGHALKYTVYKAIASLLPPHARGERCRQEGCLDSHAATNNAAALPNHQAERQQQLQRSKPLVTQHAEKPQAGKLCSPNNELGDGHHVL